MIGVNVGDMLYWDGVYWQVLEFAHGSQRGRPVCIWWQESLKRWSSHPGLIQEKRARKVGRLEALVVLGKKI